MPSRVHLSAPNAYWDPDGSNTLIPTVVSGCSNAPLQTAKYVRSSLGGTSTKAAIHLIEHNVADDFDFIVLGAGHNGLILQAYLCKAGLNVLSLDRAATAGGGLTTLEDPRYPGFLHNTHAFFHRAITAMPWYADLDLKRHGAVYVEPELNVLLLTEDGRTLEWWTDFERTAASFAQFSTRDAATLQRWYEEFAPIVSKIIRPESFSPPLPPEERHAILSRSAAGRRLLEVSALSPLEFVQREFENPTIQAGLLFFNGLREVDLRVRGFGHHIAALLAQPSKAQMLLGGSASLARALERAVWEAGGEIRTLTTPHRIVVENNRAVGVETAAGELSEPRAVASRHSIHSRRLSICWMQKIFRGKSAIVRRTFNIISSLRYSRSTSICVRRLTTLLPRRGLWSSTKDLWW